MNAYLCTAPSANNTAIPGSKVWINNLYRGLKSLGVDVALPSFDTWRHMVECMGDVEGVDPAQARAVYSEMLVRDVARLHAARGVDLFVAYVWSVHVLPEAILRIRALGVPAVLFFCNAAHQFHLVEAIARHFDYCMVPERQALPKYQAAGANPIHIQMAADPEMYAPYPGPRTYEATFVGQLYLNRPEYVGYLAWHGIDIRVWGPGWQDTIQYIRSLPARRRARRLLGDARRAAQRRLGLEPASYPLPLGACGGVLSDELMVRTTGESHVSLNFSEVRDDLTGEIKRHIRLRDFEVPMSRGLLCTGYQEELAEYYDIGREIVCYGDKAELLDKCRFYLANPGAAEAIRHAGYRRARRDHSWANRFEQLLRTMGLKAPRRFEPSPGRLV